MSTAVALQNIPQTQASGIIRHRSVSKQDTSVPSHLSSSEDAAYLSIPQDSGSIALPLSTRPFAPTHTYWITPHNLLSKSITILDLTKDISIDYAGGLTPAYKDAVKKALKDHSFTPILTCQRMTWLGLQYDIVDAQGSHVADWKHPWASTRVATLSFPESSPHSSHPISLKNKRWGFSAESFVVESALYVWEKDAVLDTSNMTLYRVFGQGDNENKTVVAKYAQKWWGAVVTGGTLVVDEREIDGTVASLTLCVVLKKKRQRAAERS